MTRMAFNYSIEKINSIVMEDLSEYRKECLKIPVMEIKQIINRSVQDIGDSYAVLTFLV